MSEQTENNVPDTVYIQGFSLRGYSLAIEEYTKQGYVVDTSNEGCPRPFINMFTTRMTKLPREENTIFDWRVEPVVTPVVVAVPLQREAITKADVLAATEKKRMGRPPKIIQV